jgi:hypothetical protein
MKLSTDSDSYLEQQEIFAGEMIARIAHHLEEAGLKDDELIHLGGNSYTHELVLGILNAMFSKKHITL